MSKITDLRIDIHAMVDRERWNAAADAINALERKQQQPTGIAAGIAAGMVLAGNTQRKVSRRNLFGLGWLKGAKP